jgi:transcriptional regulator with PAS, ATPase and Fis domain
MLDKYFNEIPVAVTITDVDGKIVFMNEKSAKVFEKYGGKELLNSSVYSCHNPVSEEKIKQMMKDKTTNAYTIEKNEIKKMIFQTPWSENNKVCGMIEFSFEIPFEMLHFIRS